MSDDSDYSVPCSCGGWLRYVDDVEQPHEHFPSHPDQAAPEEVKDAVVNVLLKFSTFVVMEDRLAGSPRTFGEWADEVLKAIRDTTEPDPDEKKAQTTLDKVRQYAKDREAYGRRGRTVHSARIASDLFNILGES